MGSWRKNVVYHMMGQGNRRGFISVPGNPFRDFFSTFSSAASPTPQPRHRDDLARLLLPAIAALVQEVLPLSWQASNLYLSHPLAGSECEGSGPCPPRSPAPAALLAGLSRVHEAFLKTSSHLGKPDHCGLSKVAPKVSRKAHKVSSACLVSSAPFEAGRRKPLSLPRAPI